jgi:hypothetical protein
MVEAEHHYLYTSRREPTNWCEGYSCRRRCALEVGLFPEGLSVPICAGEDAVFGERMAARFKRAEDAELMVSHEVPEDLEIFWDQRIGRGEGSSQRRILLDRWTFGQVLSEGILWTVKSIAWVILFFPMFRYAEKLATHLPQISARKLLWPVFLSRVAHEIGRWKGFFSVWHSRPNL